MADPVNNSPVTVPANATVDTKAYEAALAAAQARAANIALPDNATGKTVNYQAIANGNNIQYSDDLADWRNTPKHPFLYVVEINFAPEYAQIASKSKFALLTQTATRPTAKFVYQAFNDYGVRSGVLTKTEFEPVSITFIDNNDNHMFQFYTNVIRLLSPVTNLPNSKLATTQQYNFSSGTGDLIAAKADTKEASGLKPNVYAVSSGPPGQPHTSTDQTSPVSIFQSVKIHHIHGHGAAVSTFTLVNPRLTSLEFTGLSMSTSDDNSILTTKWEYDYFTSELTAMSSEIADLVGQVKYKLRADLQAGPVQQTSRSTTTTAATPNIPADIKGQQAKQAEAKSIDATVVSVVRNFAAGRFGNLFG